MSSKIAMNAARSATWACIGRMEALTPKLMAVSRNFFFFFVKCSVPQAIIWHKKLNMYIRIDRPFIEVGYNYRISSYDQKESSSRRNRSVVAIIYRYWNKIRELLTISPITTLTFWPPYQKRKVCPQQQDNN